MSRSMDIGELVGSLHNRAQKAESAAAGIEDPSTRKAVQELAGAVRELAKHLKSTAAKGPDAR